MTLEQWANEERERVDRFIRFWNASRREADDKNLWPKEMDAGEWDDQFRLWSE